MRVTVYSARYKVGKPSSINCAKNTLRSLQVSLTQYISNQFSIVQFTKICSTSLNDQNLKKKIGHAIDVKNVDFA